MKAKNITKIGDLIDIVKRNVKTNIKDWNQIKEYIPYVVEFDTDNLQSENIPGDSTRIPAGTGLWFFLADEKKTEELVEELFKNEKTKDETEEDGTDTNNSSNSTATSSTKTTSDSQKDKQDKSKIKVEILNGSGDSNLLTKATKALKNEGYNVYKTGKTSTTQVTTIINKANLSEETTSNLKSTLGTGVISSSSRASKVDVTIILGKDYK